MEAVGAQQREPLGICPRGRDWARLRSRRSSPRHHPLSRGGLAPAPARALGRLRGAVTVTLCLLAQAQQTRRAMLQLSGGNSSRRLSVRVCACGLVAAC